MINSMMNKNKSMRNKNKSMMNNNMMSKSIINNSMMNNGVMNMFLIFYFKQICNVVIKYKYVIVKLMVANCDVSKT